MSKPNGSPTLASIAPAAAECLLSTDKWLHRRVDKISFTSVAMFRREISIDFSVPPGHPRFRDGPDGRAVYFVPVFMLRKWPPVMRLDIRDPDGKSMPLLTSRRNREIDALALEGLAPPGPLRDKVGEWLGEIPIGTAASAQRSLERVAQSVVPELSEAPDWTAEQERWLQTMLVASSLVKNSLLWARVECGPDARQVIKVVTEEPVIRTPGLLRRGLVSMSWAPERFHVEVSNAGVGRSYHLQFDPPPGVKVHRSRLKMRDAAAPEPTVIEGSLAGYAAGRGRDLLWTLWNTVRVRLRDALDIRETVGGMRPEDVEPPPGLPYRWQTGARAYMYVTGEREHRAEAEIDTAIDAPGLLRSAFLIAVLTGLLLTVYTHQANEVVTQVGPAVTSLLLVPGLLGYLVVRQGEHPVLRWHVGGVRIALLVAGVLPVAAAVALLASDMPSGDDVRAWWWPMAIVAWVLAGLLAVSCLLPPVKERPIRDADADASG